MIRILKVTAITLLLAGGAFACVLWSQWAKQIRNSQRSPTRVPTSKRLAQNSDEMMRHSQRSKQKGIARKNNAKPTALNTPSQTCSPTTRKTRFRLRHLNSLSTSNIEIDRKSSAPKFATLTSRSLIAMIPSGQSAVPPANILSPRCRDTQSAHSRPLGRITRPVESS